MAGHDAAGIGNSLGKYRGQLLHDRGYGIGCHKCFADVAHDHGYCIVAKGQKAVADQHRDAYTEVFLHQIAAFHKDVAETVSDFAVPEEEMSADKAELKQAGYECAESSTGNLHPRGTQMSENEYPVEEDVDKEGKNGTEQRDRDLSYTSKHNGAGQGKADTQIRREQPTQINNAVSNNAFNRCIHLHDQSRRENRKQRKSHGKTEHKPKHDSDCLFEGSQLTHAPVTGGED